MASSKDFKQAIREGRLNDAFAIAMGNAPELHITTWVASANDSNSQPGKGNGLHTHVNLIEGEIVNEIDEKLIGDELYGTLQQFHLQQVTQGHQTISQNLQSLQQMFRLLAVLQKQQKGESYTPINAWKISDTSLPPAIESNTIANSGAKTMTFAPAPELTDFSATDEEEEDDIINELLSLDELDIDVEQPKKEPNFNLNSNPNSDTNVKEEGDEDWGDWLEEDNSTTKHQGIEIDNLAIEDDDEDWGDEDDFLDRDNREIG